MEILQAILLGVIEGLTEFLPISSTGHLIIAEEYLSFRDSAEVFTVVIQLGAIAAVAWYYRRELLSKSGGLLAGEKKAQDFWLNLTVATIPAAAVGLALASQVDRITTPGVVAAALIAGAGVLLLADRLQPPSKNKNAEADIEAITLRQALIIGLAQVVALIPGTSRSGASIVGGMFSGLNRVTATAFSFYMGLPVLGLAGFYKLAVHGDEINSVSGGWASIVVGLVVSFVVALAAISWLLKYVATHSFRIFVYYRVALGLMVLALL